MHTLLHRKAALFTLVTVYTGFFAAFLSDPLRICLLFTFLALFALSLLPWQKKLSCDLCTFCRILLCAALTGSVLLSLYTDVHVRRRVQQFSDTEQTVTATVIKQMYAASYSAGYIAEITEADGEKVRFTVLLETPNTALQVGYRITCHAAFTEPEESDGAFPLRRYYLSQGISLCAETEQADILATDTAPIRRYFSDSAEYLSAALRIALGREDYTLPAALLLGDRSHLPESLTRDFQRLGISHLLAISGFHFAVLLGMLERLLTLFISNRKLRLIPLSAAAVFFMMLCALSPSVLRAGIMMLFSYTAIAFNRSADMPTALGISVFLICLTDPAQFYSAALHLSATAVLGIACYSHVARIWKNEAPPRKSRLTSRILAPILLAVCIQFALLPFLWQYFGEISLLTPITTVLFTPLIAMILTLTPPLLLFRYVPFIARPLAFAISKLCQITTDAAGAMTEIPHTVVPLHHAAAPYFAISVMILFFSIPLLRKRKQIVCAFAGILFLCGTLVGILAVKQTITRDHIAITATVQGKNEVILVTENGKTLLCDISNGSYTAINSAYNQARKDGATELTALVLTHLHKRHIQSFDRISDTAYVRMLILPAAESAADKEIIHSLRQIAEDKNIPVREYTRGDTGIIFEDTALRIDTDTLSRSTHPVIVLSLTAYDHDTVYIGASAAQGIPIDDLSRFSTVIFGLHGPIYKTEYDMKLSSTTARVIFRGDSYEFAAESLRRSLAGHTVVQTNDAIRLYLRPTSAQEP